MIESNDPEGQDEAEGHRAFPKQVRDAAFFFVIAGVLCFASGIWSVVTIIVRTNGLHRDLVTFSILDTFSTHPPLFTIIQDLMFGAVCAAVFILGARQLRQRTPAARHILLAATIAMPVLSFTFGFKRTAVGARKAPTNPRKYLSALIDGTSYDLTARQYAPSIGQFLSPDPAANPGVGYQYGNANPMTTIDPFGMSGTSWLSVAGSITSGHATTSGTVQANCTTAAWCSQLTTGPAPLSGTVRATAAPGSVTSSCSSTKGGCPAAVVKVGSAR
jgi:RHS repeat-associated protein